MMLQFKTLNGSSVELMEVLYCKLGLETYLSKSHGFSQTSLNTLHFGIFSFFVFGQGLRRFRR